MSETFDRWTDNRNEHEASLMDPAPHYRGNEPSPSEIDYLYEYDVDVPYLHLGQDCDPDLELEASLRNWRREHPLPEPVDDGLPW